MEADLFRAFGDVETHLRIGAVIRKVSTNRNDIRALALAGLDLSGVRRVMDLGCAFGAFTEALRGRVAQEAQALGVDIIPSYEEPYLEACRRAGIPGRFSAAGTALLPTLPPASFDLVLCSYSLYFFPETIPSLVRLLADKGILVAITHFRNNARELIEIIKDVLRDRGKEVEKLSLEIIIEGFCGENGAALLSPHFGTVEKRDFENRLVFTPGDLETLESYLRFKAPLLFGGALAAMEGLLPAVMERLRETVRERGVLEVSKDDRIFVCRDPLPRRGAT
ncbi:MAG TPA: methyltransferase domain-containing protein [Syntrophales bacterium]|nr:methyltransferase domain-containing protein [Syntrophales bacterium]HOM06832.1 methyltransferase domain-containing protein [Syntrophales bacterium]HPQ06373.1 methyltransferase domain-containing protein [Syntrophales bacterium]